MEFVPDLAVLALVLVALGTDLTRQRVPNLLTFGGIALGLTWQLATHGGWSGLAGVGIALGLMVPAWLAGRTVRAGDAKLLMAIGAFWGPSDALRACLFTYILALPFGLVVLAVKGRLGNLVPSIKAGVSRAVGMDVAEPELTTVPFVPVIVAACILTYTTEVLRWF